MKHICPFFLSAPESESFVRHKIIHYGSYYRTSDRRKVQRYRCQNCNRVFSSAMLLPTYRQKKRHLNDRIRRLQSENMTQRGAARFLGVNPKTIVRKFRFSAGQAKLRHEQYLISLSGRERKLEFVQFDDLETSEHTKCKPLSVALAVEPKTRKILAFEVSQMPARGHLAEISKRKYGPRPDLRPKGWDRLMKSLKPVCEPFVTLLSDKNPHYPEAVYKNIPDAKHDTVKSRRAKPGGQGELKHGAHDPIFPVNHTCAMMRAHMSRLIRKTWANTKNQKGLVDHLWIYVDYHNRRLTQQISEGLEAPTD